MALQKVLRILFLVVCIAAALKGVWDLLHILWYEAHGAMDSDVAIYIALGRGILNGLTPYKDLFESKPPGMFLFSALSLFLFGDQTLLTVGSVLVFILIPAGLTYAAWQMSAEASQWWRTVTSLLGFMLGTAIALYLESRAGLAQTESYATLCVFAYGYTISVVGERPSYRITALLSALLLCACGLKEPFALIALGAALLMTKNPMHFVRIFIIPMLIALVTGTVLLLLLGWLGPYVTIQIPAMLGGRASANGVETYSMKLFTVGRVFGNLTTYYGAPIFGYLIALLWGLFPVWKTGRNDWKTIVLCVAQSILLYHFMVQLSLWIAVWNAHSLHLIIDGISLEMQTWILLGLGIPLFVMLYLSHRYGLLWHVMVSIIVACIAAITVGISIYATNHFAFAVALYAILALVFVRYIATSEEYTWDRIIIAFLTLLLTIVYLPDPKYTAHMQERLAYTESALYNFTKRFDGMMQSCGFTRFFGPVVYQEIAFSKFSPMGPLPIPHFHEYLGKTHPLFKETYDNVRAQVSVIVVPKDNLLPEEVSDLSPLFTKEPPACATAFIPLKAEWDVYFRKS